MATLHARRLKYLDEIVRSGSIRKAAERLNVAASAINRQVLALERELGGPVFERLPRRMRLTAMGELLIFHVRHTLKEHDRLNARIRALKGLEMGQVKIATIAMLASRPLLAVIGRLRQRYGALRMQVNVDTLGEVTAALLNGDVDLALAYDIPYSSRLQVLGEYDYSLEAVMAPEHPLAGKAEIRLTDCLAFPLAIPSARVSIRPILERALPAKATLSPALESNSIEILRDMVHLSPHITFLNALDVAPEVAAGTLTRVPVQELSGLQQKLVLACRVDSTLDAPTYLVAQEIMEVLDNESMDSISKTSVRKQSNA
jgi:DNA-binding transcriptional LysR family regulator